MVARRPRMMRRKRRVVRRRTTRATRVTRVGRRIVPKIIMQRTSNIGAWTFSTATTSGFWRYNTYNVGQHFSNFSEIAALFDEYKVNGIKVTFRPRYDSISPATVAQAYAHVIVDQDTTTTPSGTYTQATNNFFLEAGRVKTYTLNKPFSVYFKPKTGFPTSTGTVTQWPKYNKTTDTNCVYQGFHMFIQQNNFSTNNTDIILDQFVTLYISARNIK